MNPGELRAELIRKGWTIEEIEASIEILSRAPQAKSRVVKLLDRIVFWINLVLALIGNFVVSVVMIPFMLFVPSLYLYPALLVVGLTFGSLYDMVVFDIERIEDAPRIFVGPFLLGIALINIYIITTLNNLLAARIGFMQGLHIPLFVALVYTTGFMGPYIYTRWSVLKQMMVERRSGRGLGKSVSQRGS